MYFDVSSIVVSESGDIQSTASHEGSGDAESTKENASAVAEATTAGDIPGGKDIERVACELVTTAIQNAVVELQNEVLK